MGEQKRIVAAIEEQFSRLDAGVAALEEAQQKVRRMRASYWKMLLMAALSGSADAMDWIRRRQYAAAFSGLARRIRGRRCRSIEWYHEERQRSPRHNAVPFLRVANVMRDRLDPREVHQIEVFAGELERLRLQRGDLLVVEGNGSADQIGRSALWDGSIDPCVHQNHLIRVRPGSEILPAYLNVFRNAPSVMAIIQSAASSTRPLYT